MMCLEKDVEKLVKALEEFEGIINMGIRDADDFPTFYAMVNDWWEKSGRPALKQAQY